MLVLRMWAKWLPEDDFSMGPKLSAPIARDLLKPEWKW
jgi:hypothetical protein